MRALTPFLLIAGLLACATPDAAATEATSCAGRAIAQLRARSREGEAARAAAPESFGSWIDCDDAQFGLPTAVHESIHLETAETDAFPLLGGGSAARPHAMSDFVEPARIADRFEPDDFTAIYLSRGKASSATDALYLLDEFNAYTHDLATAVDLRALRRPDESVDHRDGLAATMAFVATYAEAARAEHPATWDGLRSPRVAAVLRSLWSRAERVMASSCGIPQFGTRDKDYIRRVCAFDSRSAMGVILGRAPTCARLCLAEAPDEMSEERADDASAVSAEGDAAVGTDAPRGRHPFAVAAGPRRHRAEAAD